MENREIAVTFRVTDEELARIDDKQKETGIRSRSAYLRKMALDGYCVILDMPELRELTRLLRVTSNNLNQYARRANTTGEVFAEDVEGLRVQLDEIWSQQREILDSLSSIR